MSVTSRAKYVPGSFCKANDKVPPACSNCCLFDELEQLAKTNNKTSDKKTIFISFVVVSMYNFTKKNLEISKKRTGLLKLNKNRNDI